MSAWAEAKAPDGRTYYWNTETKQTVWEKPADFDAPDSVAVDASWREAQTNEGKKYYYNAITKKTVWEPPEAYLKHQQNARPTAPAFVAGGTPGFGGGDGFSQHDRRMERRDRDRDDREYHLPQKPGYDGGRGGGGPWDGRQDRDRDGTGFRGPMPLKSDDPEYSTLEQAEEAFFKLLKRHNITPESTWEEALRLVIREREYRALKDPKERKQAFDKYCIEVRAQEKGKEKERRERLREEFRKMLSTHDDIKHYTRWKTARPSIEREAVFKSAGDEDQRRQMFDEYLIELKKQHAEAEVTKRRTALQELDLLLQPLIVDPNTKWSDAHETIEQNNRFRTDDTFRPLSKLDILNAFDSHIKSLERATNDAKQKDKRLSTRRERQARDAFKELLSQQTHNGKINAGTKWQEFLPLIVDEERYATLIGTPGSSPLDLFWDVVEAEDQKLRSKRNQAMDILEEQQYEMTTQTTPDEFAKIMRLDSRMAGINSDQMKLIYNKLMDKIVQRVEEVKAREERNQRKAVDALRSVIKHLEPPVRVGDSYDEVAARLVDHDEYRMVSDDEARRTAFHKHIKRLKEKEEDLERERARRERERDHRNGSRRDRDRRHRTRTPEVDAYEADRRKAQADRERQYRKASFGLTPPPRDRRDDRYDRDRRPERRDQESMSIYERERRERELERERNYVSRADPRDKGRSLDYGDEDAVGSGSRPGSIRKRRDSDGGSNGSRRESKRTRRTRTPEPEPMKDEPPALQSGSEEGEIEEI